MATSILLRNLDKNPQVIRAAAELLAVNLKYGDDGGSDEYGAEAGAVIGRCFSRMGVPDPDLGKLTRKQWAVSDTVMEAVNSLETRMERALQRAKLVPAN